MLFLVFAKIYNNKWLIASLLLGMILTVAMVCSVPLYTNGILQRMLIKDLENYQNNTSRYPGNYEIKVEFSHRYSEKGQQYKTYNYFSNRIDGSFVSELDVETVAQKNVLQIDYLYATPEELYGKDEDSKELSKIFGISDLNEHITLLSGRLPSNEIEDGVLECLIMPIFQKKNNIILNKTYIVQSFAKNKEELFKIKPVGLFDIGDANDPWWTKTHEYKNVFFLDYDYVKAQFLYEREMITRAQWFFELDYTKIQIEDLQLFIETMNTQQVWLDQYMGAKANFKSLSIFEHYFTRERQLKTTLWVLQAPILIMLAFYIFMVAQLVVENDKNEISILKSRGSSRWQVFLVYLIQSTFLAAHATVIGPFLGVFICKILGASNGFLEFVARTSLPIKMTSDAIFYSILAGIFSVIVMMIPVLKASKISIVELKQKRARKWNAPWWQKVFLDVVLLGTSIYGLNDYIRQGEARMVVEAAGIQAPLDPFMFIILTLFILGIGLLFLRLYPYLIKLLHLAGKKIWHPVLYSSFIQVGRTSGREQFLMLFLILTIAIGIFSANSARTINQNIEDRVYYNIGSDITLKTKWKSNEVPDFGGAGEMQNDTVYTRNEPVIYIEPPFEIISSLDDTIAAAKVYKPQDTVIKFKDKSTKSISKKGVLMAITPDEFGETVWNTHNLLPHHINEYLNLLTYSLNAVIVSDFYRSEYELETGDAITYSWAGQASIEGVIVAFAKYWPGINPYESEINNHFVIANLNFVQAKSALEPYEIWYKTKENASTSKIFESIEEKNIELLNITVAKQELIDKKNDPLLQGINGAMTLSFVVTMAISMIGFIIYWILSIKSRVLQFGIFRAMGMTKGNILSMIAIEQLLISVVAIAAGIFIGGLSCQLFMPLLQVVNTTAQQVPPYKLVALRQDYIKIYAIISAMILIGFTIIGVLVSKIKIAQVIKLGED